MANVPPLLPQPPPLLGIDWGRGGCCSPMGVTVVAAGTGSSTAGTRVAAVAAVAGACVMVKAWHGHCCCNGGTAVPLTVPAPLL